MNAVVKNISSKKYKCFCVFVILSLIFVVLLYTVPYYFPPHHIAISTSYNVGFNNMLGILLLGVFCVFFILFAFFTREKALIVQSCSNTNDLKVLFIVLGTLSTLCLSTTILIYARFKGYGEGAYFIPHLINLDLGREPYVDFEFGYGPLMIYIPHLFHCVFKFLNFATSVEISYYVALVIYNILGIYFAKYVIENIVNEVKLKKILFVLAVIWGYPYHLGANYTLCRFLLPVYLLMLWMNNFSYKKTHTFSSIVSLICCELLVLGYSMEFGVAFIFTIVIRSIVHFFFERDKRYILHVLVTICAILTVYLCIPKLFTNIFTFGSGGFNFPFVVSFALTAYFICCFIVAFQVGKQLQNVRENINVLTIELLAFSFTPGALGRCDPGHILYNGFMIFIFAVVYIRRYTIKGKYLLYGFLLLFFASAIPYMFISTKDWLFAEMCNDKYNIAERIEKSKQVNTAKNQLLQIKGNAKIVVPYIIDSDYYNVFLKSRIITPLYFYGNLLDAKGFELHLMELKTMQPTFLLVPKYFRSYSLQSDETGLLSLLFFTKYRLSPIKNGNILMEISFLKRLKITYLKITH